MADVVSAPIARRPGPLPPARIHDAAQDRNVYNACPFTGTKLDDVLEPRYWAHMSNILRPWDRIEVIPEDGVWWAELMVREVDQGSVRVFVLRETKFNDVNDRTDTDSPFLVQFTPATKWRVVRKADAVVVSEGHLTRDDAWIAAGRAIAPRRAVAPAA